MRMMRTMETNARVRAVSEEEVPGSACARLVAIQSQRHHKQDAVESGAH